MVQGCKVCRYLQSTSASGGLCLKQADRQLTDVFEGSIIRCFRRLQELLRQMACELSSCQ